ncbi:Uncharacterised protein [Candidatus Anstonella stagnisolia]|nr:Uncharacterised protein [Candidatus Anstonella stagnisolia]
MPPTKLLQKNASALPHMAHRHAAGVFAGMLLAGTILISGCAPLQTTMQKNERSGAQVGAPAQETPQNAFLKLYNAANSAEEQRRLVGIVLQEEGADRAYMLLKDNAVGDQEAQAMLAWRLVKYGSPENMLKIASECEIKDQITRAALLVTVINDAEEHDLLALLEAGKLTENWPTGDEIAREKIIEMGVEFHGRKFAFSVNSYEAVELATVIDILRNWSTECAVQAFAYEGWELPESKALIGIKILKEIPEDLAKEFLGGIDAPADLKELLNAAIKMRQAEQNEEENKAKAQKIRLNGS